MPPLPFLEPTRLDSAPTLFTKTQIYELLPQKHEFAQLDAVIYFDKETGLAAGVREIKPDEWWCKGHMPGNPIFPGVLMVECAAQLAAFVQHFVMPLEGTFMAFGGIDNAKFRGSVVPPARIVLVGKLVEARPRRFICDVQAYSQAAMVFEGRITGMPLKV